MDLESKKVCVRCNVNHPINHFKEKSNGERMKMCDKCRETTRATIERHKCSHGRQKQQCKVCVNTKIVSKVSNQEDLLYKLRTIGDTQCGGKLAEMMKSWVCFEVVCALEKTIELGKEVRVWSDIPLETKSNIGLPIEDVGIDYMDLECSFAGQSKMYCDGSRIKACDIDRTRLCAYRAVKYSKNC